MAASTTFTNALAVISLIKVTVPSPVTAQLYSLVCPTKLMLSFVWHNNITFDFANSTYSQ